MGLNFIFKNNVYSPDDTEWEGGTFELTMKFSEEYPNKAPKVKFVTKMFHPNGKDYSSKKDLSWCTA